jgi:hypothetical protein
MKKEYTDEDESSTSVDCPEIAWGEGGCDRVGLSEGPIGKLRTRAGRLSGVDYRERRHTRAKRLPDYSAPSWIELGFHRESSSIVMDAENLAPMKHSTHPGILFTRILLCRCGASMCSVSAG